ncbi:MAG: acetyl/propionyl-CoA carboxylase subunit alpha, partial [Pseudomonadota bacterium]
MAVKIAPALEGYDVRHRGVRRRAIVATPRSAELHAMLPEKEKPDTSKLIISPMPGLVVSIDVENGQAVEEGEAVCVV